MTFVIQAAIDRLQKMKKYKYWLKGRFRQDIDYLYIVEVSANFFKEGNMYARWQNDDSRTPSLTFGLSVSLRPVRSLKKG